LEGRGLLCGVALDWRLSKVRVGAPAKGQVPRDGQSVARSPTRLSKHTTRNSLDWLATLGTYRTAVFVSARSPGSRPAAPDTPRPVRMLARSMLSTER
jgi:hypothetical protein